MINIIYYILYNIYYILYIIYYLCFVLNQSRRRSFNDMCAFRTKNPAAAATLRFSLGFGSVSRQLRRVLALGRPQGEKVANGSLN